MDEFEDKKIKEFFAKDKLIPDKTNQAFDNTLDKIKMQEESKKRKFMPIIYFRKLATVAACTLMVFMGANVYARANGYNNIFFMVKEIVDNKTMNQQEIFSDKEIIISYQSFSLTDYIEMQVNKLQIKDGKATLYLYVKEKNENNTTPLKYKVINQNGKIAFEGTSFKTERMQYSEVLELKQYDEKQKIITLQVLDNSDKLLKTVVINLEDKIIEARTESIEVNKISQIRLSEFLRDETKKVSDSTEEERFLILKLTDISYNGQIYTVRYLYSKITDDDIKDNKIEEAVIKEGTVKFVIKDEKYILSEIEIDNKNEKLLEKMNQNENKIV